jgi:hypothetical protein
MLAFSMARGTWLKKLMSAHDRHWRSRSLVAIINTSIETVEKLKELPILRIYTDRYFANEWRFFGYGADNWGRSF